MWVGMVGWQLDLPTACACTVGIAPEAARAWRFCGCPPCPICCSRLALRTCSCTLYPLPPQIEMLTYLAGVTKGPVQKVEILINVITVTFDMNQPTQVGSGRGKSPERRGGMAGLQEAWAGRRAEE